MHYRSSLWFGLLAFAMNAGVSEGANESSVAATESRHAVGWRLPGGETVRAVHESTDNPVPTLDRSPVTRPVRQAKKLSSTDRAIQARMTNTSATANTPTTVSAFVIHSPPVDGFVPHIAVVTTDAQKTNDEWDANASMTVTGNYTVADPQTEYGFGLFDTGAGISLLSNENASLFDLLAFYTYNTGQTVTMSGVTGSADAWVSQPIGVWMAGLGAINPADQTLDTSRLVGQWNVSVAMGQPPADGAPDIATAIGSPMAVFFNTSIRNDLMHTVHRGDQTYAGPDITFFDQADTSVPQYPNQVPLELRPLGSAAVMYWPCFASLEYCPGGDGSPKVPSLLMGTGSQSLFFVASVNLTDNGHSASNRDRFMLDTGAQVTVVGTRVGALLGLNPAKAEFTVEIEGVDGQVVNKPGFFIDSLEIPAIGDWLSFTKVPVIMLDVASPEGSTLDGIIGMNLLTRYNLVLRGGGLAGDSPWLDFAPLPPINADFDGDGDIDMNDFAYFQRCITNDDVPQTDPSCDAAHLDGDTDVDRHDLRLFLDCASGPNLPAVQECTGG